VGRNFTVCYSEKEDLAEMTRVYQQRFADRATDLALDLQVTFRSGKTVDLEIYNTFINLEEGRSLFARRVSRHHQAQSRGKNGNGP